MRNIVVINETHTLVDEQKRLLDSIFGDYEFMKSPQRGWTVDDMNELDIGLDDNIIFVSPIPYLLAKLCKNGYNVYLFHNDKREKVELPNGRVIFKVPETGWKLLKI